MSSLQLLFKKAKVEQAKELQSVIVSFETADGLTLFAEFNKFLATANCNLVFPLIKTVYVYYGYKLVITCLQLADNNQPMFLVRYEKI